MNILKSFSCRIATVATVLSLVLASCSKTETADRRADLLANVPDDATITVAFSPAAILTSAGIEVKSDGLTLSKSIERLLSSDQDAYSMIKKIAGAKGINYNSAVIAGGTTGGCVLLALQDAGKFCSWAKDNGLTVENEGEYTVCYTDQMSPVIVVDGLTAWFYGSADKAKAVSMVEETKAAATEKKLADWKLPILTKGDVDMIIDMSSYSLELNKLLSVVGMSNLVPDCEEGLYSTCDFNLDGSTLAITGDVYDSNGKIAPMFAEGTYTPLSKGIVDLVKGSQWACAASLPETYKNIFMAVVLSEMRGMSAEQQNTVSSLVGSIRNFALGFSMDENAMLINPKPSDFAATLALNIDKPAFGKAINTLLAGFPEPQVAEAVNAWINNTSTTIHPTGVNDFSITFAGEGDFAIASTDEAKALTKIDPSDVTNLTAYFKLDLPKGHALPSMFNCPFGVDAEGYTTDSHTEGHVTLTETDAPFLETLINFAARF